MALYGKTKEILALDPMHKLAYHMNDFLASKPGQKLADHPAMNQFPEAQKALKSQVSMHQKITEQMAKKQTPKV